MLKGRYNQRVYSQ